MLQQNITFCVSEYKPCQADLYKQNSSQLCRGQYRCVLVTTHYRYLCVSKGKGKLDHVHTMNAQSYSSIHSSPQHYAYYVILATQLYANSSVKLHFLLSSVKEDMQLTTMQ